MLSSQRWRLNQLLQAGARLRLRLDGDSAAWVLGPVRFGRRVFEIVKAQKIWRAHAVPPRVRAP